MKTVKKENVKKEKPVRKQRPLKPTGIFSKKPVAEECQGPSVVVTVVVVVVGDKIVETVVDTDINKLDDFGHTLASSIASGLQKARNR